MSLSLSTAKLTEMPSYIFSTPARRPPFLLLLKPLSSLRLSVTVTAEKAKIPSRNYGKAKPAPLKSKQQSSHSSSWLNKWPHPVEPLASSTKPVDLDTETRVFDEHTRTGGTAIERIVFRLRNLGLGSDDEEEEGDEGNSGLDVNGEGKLGDLLKRDWVRPDSMLLESDDEDDDETLLPWERSVEGKDDVEEEGKLDVRRRMVKAPTLAELTIEEEELRRLRRQGIHLREKINVPKAGVTGAVLEKIHDKWRKNELVRLKFHEALAHDMKTAHRIVEVGAL